MSDQKDATEGPPKRRYLPREHPIQVLFDEATIDAIEKARKYQRPSDGKEVSEPRSTFIYNIVKSHLEKCATCGGPLTRSCPKCAGGDPGK
jgi:hypothetical protein